MRNAGRVLALMFLAGVMVGAGFGTVGALYLRDRYFGFLFEKCVMRK